MSTLTYCFSYPGQFYLFLKGYPQILVLAWRFIWMPLLLGLMFQDKNYKYSFSRDQPFSPLLGLYAANEWWEDSVALPRIRLRGRLLLISISHFVDHSPPISAFNGISSFSFLIAVITQISISHATQTFTSSLSIVLKGCYI